MCHEHAGASGHGLEFLITSGFPVHFSAERIRFCRYYQIHSPAEHRRGSINCYQFKTIYQVRCLKRGIPLPVNRDRDDTVISVVRRGKKQALS